MYVTNTALDTNSYNIITVCKTVLGEIWKLCWSACCFGKLWKTLKSIPSLVWAVTLTAICSARLRRRRRCYSTCCVPRPVLCMILRDEAKKSAQKSSEEAAIDVKFTVNLHFSSINCSGDNLYFIDPFQRYLLERQKKANQRSFRKRVGGRVVLEPEISGKFSDFTQISFANSDTTSSYRSQ